MSRLLALYNAITYNNSTALSYDSPQTCFMYHMIHNTFTEKTC